MNLIYDVIPPGCTLDICPSCKRLFCKDDNHKECNDCVVGMVWVKTNSNCYDFGYYEYHSEKDIHTKHTMDKEIEK